LNDIRKAPTPMKKLEKINKVRKFIAERSIQLSEKTIIQTTQAKGIFNELGKISIFIAQTLRELFYFPFEFKEFFRQCYQVGNRSFALVSVTGCIMGVVLTIQSRPVLVDFGAVSMLPQMVAVSLVREIGPVLTALICAGKVGSGIGAELGSMRVTEQIDSMEVSATNPMKYLVLTRVLAATLMIPILAIFADTMGLFGSWAGVNIKGDVNLVLFFSRAFSALKFTDLMPAVVKTFFFGFVIGIIGCYKGYTAGKGTESVGVAANSAVVISSLLIIVIDLIAVQLTDMLT
jgi:phospholipid/cholesterol/gamma-HCH transport system permease protein